MQLTAAAVMPPAEHAARRPAGEAGRPQLMPVLDRQDKVMIEARIPKATIEADVPPDQFRIRMEDVARSQRALIIHSSHDCGGIPGLNVLLLTPGSVTRHSTVEGRLIVDPDCPTVVSLEVCDDNWRNPAPGYDEYVRSLRKIFEPLIAIYNRLHRSQRRLRIQPKAELFPQLPDGAARIFRRFCVAANKRVLHARDWRRLYGFIRYCHARHVKLSDSDLEYLLIGEAFPSDVAEDIASVYRHGRSLLNIR